MTDQVDPVASAAGRALRALRKTSRGDVRLSSTNVPIASSNFAPKDIRHHKARCEKNPSVIRRIQEELAE